jgi:hypothetical protein
MVTFENNQRSRIGSEIMRLSAGSIAFRVAYLAMPVRNATAH